MEKYILIWYLIGFFGGLYIAKKYDGHISIFDFVVCATIYGVGGFVSFLLGLYHLKKVKKLYKKYGIKNF